jgi:PadR family transcriptional regulator, regulatory protein PadR
VPPISDLPRVTLSVLRVLRVLLDHPSALHYGLDISKQAELKTGTIYPILTRLEEAGWVVSNWEEADPRTTGRPRRRLYKLTDGGAERAATVLHQHQQAIAPAPRGLRDLGAGRPWGSPA